MTSLLAQRAYVDTDLQKAFDHGYREAMAVAGSMHDRIFLAALTGLLASDNNHSIDTAIKLARDAARATT